MQTNTIITRTWVGVAEPDTAEYGGWFNTAIGKLDYDMKAISGYYVSSVKQVDGVITVTTDTFPTASTGSKGMVTVVNNYSTAPEDIFTTVPSSMAFMSALKEIEKCYKNLIGIQ